MINGPGKQAIKKAACEVTILCAAAAAAKATAEGRP